MPPFGKRPDLDFPLKPILDGTEELYTQTGGVNNKFTLAQIASYVNGLAAPSPFVVVDTEGDLPTGAAINTDVIYVVRSYQSGGPVSFIWDTNTSAWIEVDSEASVYVVVANMAALPATGDETKIYIVEDDGSGNARLLRWDSNTGTYKDLDTDTAVYEVADIAARDAIVNPYIGHVALITDANGLGSRGISFYTGANWTTAFIESGLTNLSHTKTANDVTVVSSTGSNTTIAGATTSLAGMMTAADKTRLNQAVLGGTNAGTTGGSVGVFSAKVGDNLTFKNLLAQSSKITIVNVPASFEIGLDVDHAAVLGAGNTDQLPEGVTNLYYTDARARAAIGINPNSLQYLDYNSSTGLIEVKQLLFTSVNVYGGYADLAAFVATEYTAGNEFQEGDVIILTDPDPTETWIHNGGTAITTADFTSVSTSLDESAILALLSSTDPISYNPVTGVIGLNYSTDSGNLAQAGTDGGVFVPGFTMTNVGAGVGVYKQLTGQQFELKSLISSNSSIGIASGTNDIDLTLGTVSLSDLSDVPTQPTGGTTSYFLQWNDTGDTFTWQDTSIFTGEANDGENLATSGVGVYNDKDGVNLRFRRLNPQSSMITITLVSDVIEFNIDAPTVAANHTLGDIGDITISGTPATDDVIKWNGLNWVNGPQTGGGGSGISSLALAGDSGVSQTLNDGNTILVAGGIGISTTAGPTDTVTVNLNANISDLQNIPALPGTAGTYLLEYNQAGDSFSWSPGGGLSGTRNGLSTDISGNVGIGGQTLVDATTTLEGDLGTEAFVFENLNSFTVSAENTFYNGNNIRLGNVSGATSITITAPGFGSAPLNAPVLAAVATTGEIKFAPYALPGSTPSDGFYGLTFASGVGTFTAIAGTTFTLAGDSGSSQSIVNGDTVTLAGGTGIDTVAGATDTVTINLNAAISDLNNIPTLPGSAGNYLLNYNNPAGFTWAAVPASGYMSAWTLSGDSGVDQTINQANTVNFQGGTGIDTVGVATDTLQIALNAAISDLNNIPALPGVAGTYLLQYAQATDTFSWAASTGGAFNSLSLAGSSGPTQTVNDLDTITIAGGTGIDTVAGPTDTITVSLNATISQLSNIPGLPGSVGTYLLQYDQGSDTFTWESATASNDFFLAADSGGNQTIATGDTMTVAGGTGIDTVASATDTVTIVLNAAIEQLNNVPALPGSPGQYRLEYDQAGNNFTWVTSTGGAFSGLTLAGSSGTPQSIGDADTITIAAGSGISTVAGATDTVTVSLDAAISQLNNIPALPVSSGTYRLEYVQGTDTFSWVTNTLMTFTIAGDTGSPTNIANGDTFTIIGGTNLTSVMGSDQVTLNWSANISDLSNIPALPGSAGDYRLNYAQGTDTFTWVAAGAGSMTSFTLAGDTGSTQTISDGNTLSIEGGTNISTVAGATDTLTINWSAVISDLSNIPSLPGTAGDYRLNYNQGTDTFTWVDDPTFIESFTIAGNAGSDTVLNGETFTFVGGTGINTTASTNALAINLDAAIEELNNVPALPGSAGSYLLEYAQAGGTFTWEDVLKYTHADGGIYFGCPSMGITQRRKKVICTSLGPIHIPLPVV
jgi:hypothetical protein